MNSEKYRNLKAKKNLGLSILIATKHFCSFLCVKVVSISCINDNGNTKMADYHDKNNEMFCTLHSQKQTRGV